MGKTACRISAEGPLESILVAVPPMKRVTVYLRPQQVETLRDLAKRRGVSFAEIVRQGVDCFLAEEDPLWNIIYIAERPCAVTPIKTSAWLTP